jgi:branched-chain amino acid aminotransferase
MADGRILDVAGVEPYLNLVETHPAVYEVIRVEEGVPLFFEDYMERLTNSFRLLGRDMPLPEKALADHVHELIHANNHTSGPVKLVFGAGAFDFFVAFIMKPHLPRPEEYRTGVRTVLMHEMRSNPNLKMWNRDLRDRSVKLLRKSGAYEAILVDEEGYITEASRSNVFFIRGQEVITTDDTHILPGITRKKVLEVCREKEIAVRFQRIPAGEVDAFDACFLTGTARKVVPVRFIGATEFKVETRMFKNISTYFGDYVDRYIREHS